MEVDQINPELIEYSDYPELSQRPSFASRIQLFAVIVYLITQGFTIPILPIGPSWAVWPRLDDFATVFLFLVYLNTRNNMCPMSKTERFVFILIIIGVVLSFPSTLFGKVMRPELPKTLSYGIFQTFRVFEYLMVWVCIRGMTFSSKQFDKISYTVFFVVVFVVIIGIANATGAIPSARLLAHLPYEGPWGVLKIERIGADFPIGPYGDNPGYMVRQLVFFTALLLASRKPSAMFRIPLLAVMAIVIFLSGARSATAAWCISLAIFVHKSVKQLIILLIVIFLFLTSFYIFGSFFEVEVVERATERAKTLVHRETFEEQTLSGRTLQWAAALRYIASDPSVSVLGTGWGFGGVVLAPVTAIGTTHCMYLMVLLELGIFGALIFYILLFNMYQLLRGKDRLLVALRAAFLALLVASITSEVFYPVVSMGSFLGFVGAVFGIGAASYRGRLLEEQLYSEYEPSEEEDFGYEYSV